MGFNKRWVNLNRCINYLKEGNLKQYYGNSDMFYFENETCSFIYDLHCQGKSDEEILIIINQKLNMEEKPMKCIKLIKQIKNGELGEVIRTTDTEAELRVKGGNWAYAPKSEWKIYNGKSKKSNG